MFTGVGADSKQFAVGGACSCPLRRLGWTRSPQRFLPFTPLLLHSPSRPLTLSLTTSGAAPKMAQSRSAHSRADPRWSDARPSLDQLSPIQIYTLKLSCDCINACNPLTPLERQSRQHPSSTEALCTHAKPLHRHLLSLLLSHSNFCDTLLPFRLRDFHQEQKSCRLGTVY